MLPHPPPDKGKTESFPLSGGGCGYTWAILLEDDLPGFLPIGQVSVKVT